MSIEEQRAEPESEQGATTARRQSARASETETSPAASAPAPTTAPGRADPRDALAAAFASHLGAAGKPPASSDSATAPSIADPEDEQPPAEPSEKIHRLGQQLLRMPAPLSDFDRRAIRAMATELIEIEEKLEPPSPAAAPPATEGARPEEGNGQATRSAVTNPFLWPSTNDPPATTATVIEAPAPHAAPDDSRPAEAPATTTITPESADDDKPARRAGGMLIGLTAILAVLLIVLIALVVVRGQAGRRNAVTAAPPSANATVASTAGSPAASAPPTPTSVGQSASVVAAPVTAAQTTSSATTTISETDTASAATAATSATVPATATAVPASPTPPPASASALAQRVAQAEAGLRTGDLTVVSDLGAGAKATATLTFDLGDAQHQPRLHITSVYSSPAGTQTDERIIIGGTSWQHQANGQWVTTDETEGVWGRVQAYLPRASVATNPTADSGATPVLHWNDATRGAGVVLRFDATTGIPSELQLAPTGGPAVDVHYSNWNGPVTINPPAK